MNKTAFGLAVKRLRPEIDDQNGNFKITVNGERVHAWRGIGLKV